MLALIARYLEIKDEEKKVLDAFGQRATELNLLTSPARASFFGLSRDPKSKFGLRPRDEGSKIGDSDDGMFI
jgi:hypothetical protein